jgi:hypothetical protein
MCLSLKVVAGLSEKPTDDEERQANDDVENIKQHSNSNLTARV